MLKLIPVLLSICLFLVPGLLAAQNLNSCAYAHAQSIGREAVSTTTHIRRMNQYDVTFYKLDLQLERNTTAIAGEVTTMANLRTARLDTFAFELHPNFEIQSVTVNGVAQQNITRANGDVSVRLATPLQPPTTLTAVIRYSGTAPQEGGGYRTATEATWGNQVSWSLSQPFSAYEWWPTKQVLTDKADSVHVFVTTSADNKVGSNGLLTAVVDLPNGKRRHEWKSRYPIVYYLISVALSNYEEYVQVANPAGAAAPIPILNYVYSGGALTRFKTEIDLTAPLIEHFSELFSLYPFHREKYGHSMAPMGGGMEHQTMTTQSTFTLFLTAHELGHQWFGDNVTCASWEDIWLNEGLASYTEYLAFQRFRPAQAEPWMQEAHDLAIQRPTGTIRVADTTNVNRIFDYSLTYKKGAAVTHMLRYEVNDDALFFQALRNYQQQLGGGTATTADLQHVFEQTINRDLDHFFEQWYNGNGFPIFEAEWNQRGKNVLLLSNQTGSGSTPLFKTDVEYLFTMTDGSDTLVRVPHKQANERYIFRFDKEVASVVLDPNNWLLNSVIGITKNTGLAVPEENAPLLYPNPAYRILQLENLAFVPTLAEIYDSTGRLVKQQVLQSGTSIEIQVAGLPAGLYVLQVRNSQDRYRTTFVKVQQP